MAISDLIKDLGGSSVVAAKTAYSPEAVRQWVYRDKLPRGAWPDLLDAFPRLSLALLKKLEAGEYVPNSIGASPRADGLAADAATLPSEISPLSDGSLSDGLPDSWSISATSQDEAVKSPPINTANLGQPVGELTGGAR